MSAGVDGRQCAEPRLESFGCFEIHVFIVSPSDDLHCLPQAVGGADEGGDGWEETDGSIRGLAVRASCVLDWPDIMQGGGKASLKQHLV